MDDMARPASWTSLLDELDDAKASFVVARRRLGSIPGCTDPGTNLPMPCGARPELFMMCGDAELVLRNTFIRITLLTRLMRLQLLLVA
jgi:hypothetical protein